MRHRRSNGDRRHGTAGAGIVLSAGAGVLLAAAAGFLWLLGGTTPPPAIGGPFRLTQDNGQVVTDRDFRGRTVLLYFGYTSCPDQCPTTLQAIAEATRLLGRRAAGLRTVFVTVDPARDTPAVVRDYVRAFGPNMVGLSGTPAEIAAAERAYRVVSTVRPPDPETGTYSVDHTAVLFLLAPSGRLIALLPASGSGAEIASELANDLPRRR